MLRPEAIRSKRTIKMMIFQVENYDRLSILIPNRKEKKTASRRKKKTVCMCYNSIVSLKRLMILLSIVKVIFKHARLYTKTVFFVYTLYLILMCYIEL